MFNKQGNHRPCVRDRNINSEAQSRLKQENQFCILDDDGSLYLNEVQQELFELSGEWWSHSTISRKLHNDLEYSL